MTKNNNNKSNPSRRVPPRGQSGKNQSISVPKISPMSVGSAYNTQISATAPRFISTKDGMRVQHREYVGDVGDAGAGFNIVNQLNINPGLQTMGPWLSTVGGSFECYELHSLRYVYQASVPTSTAGTVFMAIDYDAADSPPISKAQMMSMTSAVSTSAWASAAVYYDCKANKYMSNRFTRITSISGDVKTYDAGILYIAVECPSGLLGPGNIFVEYDVTLRLPQIPTNAALAVSSKISNSTTSGLSAIGDYISGAPLFRSLAGSLASGGWTSLSTGDYLLTYAIGGTAIANALPTWTLTGSGSVTDAGYSILTTTSNAGIYQAVVRIADAGAAVHLALTNVATIVDSYLRIAKYSYPLF